MSNNSLLKSDFPNAASNEECKYSFKKIPGRKREEWQLRFNGQTVYMGTTMKIVVEALFESPVPLSRPDIKRLTGVDFSIYAESPIKRFSFVKMLKKSDIQRPYFMIFIDSQKQTIPPGFKPYKPKERRISLELDLTSKVCRPENDLNPKYSDYPYISLPPSDPRFDKIVDNFKRGDMSAFQRVSVVQDGIEHPEEGRWFYVGEKQIGQQKPHEP